MAIVFNVLWLLCCYILSCALFGPLVILLYMAIKCSSLTVFLSGFPFAILSGLLATFAILKLFYLLTPVYKPGHYRLFQDRGSILWAINNAPSTLLLKWLQGTLFLNDTLRYLMLRALGCNVYYSSWITSNVHLSDLRHIHIGKNSMIGEMCFISPSIQTRRNRLRVAPIIIGDDVMVGYKSEIGPGCRIGNATEIQSQVTLTINNRIGSQCSIGAGTVILPNVTIGNNVRIGVGCIIYPHVKLPDNTVINDGEVIRSGRKKHD